MYLTLSFKNFFSLAQYSILHKIKFKMNKKLNNIIGPCQRNKKSLGNVNSFSAVSKSGRVASPEFRKSLNNQLKKVIIQANLIRKDVSQVAVDQMLEGKVGEIEEHINHTLRRLSSVHSFVTDHQLLNRNKKTDSLAERLVKAGKFSSVEEYNEFKKTK